MLLLSSACVVITPVSESGWVSTEGMLLVMLERKHDLADKTVLLIFLRLFCSKSTPPLSRGNWQTGLVADYSL